MLRTGAIESGVGAASRLCRRTPKGKPLPRRSPVWRSAAKRDSLWSAASSPDAVGAHTPLLLAAPPPVSSLAKNLGEAHPRPIRLVAVVELVPLPILTGRSSAPKKRSLWSAVAESRRDGDTALDGGPRVLECVAPLRVGWHVYKMLRTGAIESGVGAASRLCRRTPKAVAFRGVPPNWRMPPIPTGGPVAAP